MKNIEKIPDLLRSLTEENQHYAICVIKALTFAQQASGNGNSLIAENNQQNCGNQI